MLLHMFFALCAELPSHKFETFLFKTRDDWTDKSPLNTVRFDHNISSFPLVVLHFHLNIIWTIMSSHHNLCPLVPWIRSESSSHRACGRHTLLWHDCVRAQWPGTLLYRWNHRGPLYHRIVYLLRICCPQLKALRSRTPHWSSKSLLRKPRSVTWTCQTTTQTAIASNWAISRK